MYTVLTFVQPRSYTCRYLIHSSMPSSTNRNADKHTPWQLGSIQNRVGYRITTRVSNSYSCTGTEVTGDRHSLAWVGWPKPVIHGGLMEGS